MIIQPTNGSRFIGGRRLPAEYQQVEYIATDGSCYIDSLCAPTPYCRMELDAQWITRRAGGTFGLIDYSYDDTQRRFGVGSASNRFFLEMGIAEATKFYMTDTQRHLFVLDRLNAKTAVDDTYMGVSGLTIDGWTGRTRSFLLFARLDIGDTISSLCLVGTRCFAFRWYENDVIQSSMVPCYRKSDNVIGMYDIVRNVFFVNQGTGVFSKGPDVY